METAYSFIRWSTKLQGLRGSTSRTRQLNQTKNWCAANKYLLSDEVFIGDAESGFEGEHMKVDKKTGKAIGALALFFEAVKAGRIKQGSVLCVDSVDRFSRQPTVQSMAHFLELIHAGIGVAFVGSYYNKAITMELLKTDGHYLRMVFDELDRSYRESAEKSRKVKEAKHLKRLEIQSGKPVPHNNAPHYFTWNSNKKHYEHNENTPIVQRMVNMYLDGSSLYGIAKTFNKEGVPTFRIDAAWSSNAVRSILRNRSLIGEFLGNTSFFPRIVSDEAFDRVQSILAHNKSFNRGRIGNLINVFRGIAFCRCGKSMCVLTQHIDPHTKMPHKRPYRYLRCSTKGNGKGCLNSHVIRLDWMEEEFFGNFIRQDPRGLVADKTEAQTLNAEIAKTKLAIEDLSRGIDKLLAVDMDIPELKRRLATLAAQRDAENSRLDKLALDLSKVETGPQHFDDLKKLCFESENEPPDATTLDKDLTLHLSAKAKAFDEAIARMNITLQDNTIRRKIRTLLPSLVGKIVVYTTERRFEVVNHSGNVIYKSLMGVLDNAVFEFAP